MTESKIHLFGKCLVQRDGKAVPSVGGSKAQELLCYLLLHRQRPHPRDGLATLLWAECPAASAKKYLRQALWQLQSAVGERPDADGEGLLVLESEWIGINPEADLWVDVEELELAFEVTRDTPGRRLEPHHVEVLKKAVELYKGDLLEGCYEDWCLFERERLQEQYLSLLDRLTGYCEARGQYEEGLLYGMRILNLDRARERTHRRLMRLYSLLGDRTSALRQFERCSRALDKELDVEPARETVDLYHRIRQDQPVFGEAAATRDLAAGGGNADAAAVLGHWREMHRDLERLLEQVRREMLSMESLLQPTAKKIEIETLHERSKDARQIAA